MYKLETVRKIETDKIFWGFEIQTDRSVQRPDLMFINKKETMIINDVLLLTPTHGHWMTSGGSIQHYGLLGRMEKSKVIHANSMR